MATISFMCEQLTGIYERSIREDVQSWGDELFWFLKKYNISRAMCQQIARQRAKFAIDRLERKTIDIFCRIEGTQHAVDIYNAYIRHMETNYDCFCEAVSACMCTGSVLDKNVIKALWRQQFPEEFDAYEKKCIFIDDRLRRVYNQHFVY